MFDTVAQVAFAVALILPGFIVVQLSERRRPATPAGGDLELILRGLVYALIIQAVGALTGWLPDLAHKVHSEHIADHLGALAAYGLLLCVLAPTLLGLGLGSLLRDAESRGALEWWHYALGARDARRAWDYMFSRHNGAWMRVYLKDPPATGPVAMVGKYGTQSWAAQSPADPDLYLQEVWATDPGGQVTQEALDHGSLGGMWIDGGQIARIEALATETSGEAS